MVLPLFRKALPGAQGSLQPLLLSPVQSSRPSSLLVAPPGGWRPCPCSSEGETEAGWAAGRVNSHTGREARTVPCSAVTGQQRAAKERGGWPGLVPAGVEREVGTPVRGHRPPCSLHRVVPGAIPGTFLSLSGWTQSLYPVAPLFLTPGLAWN